jgi:ADP-heptose:LPS heptosyltransferase
VPNAYGLHFEALDKLGWERVKPLQPQPLSGRIIILAPFASAATKQWPIEEALGLAEQLALQGWEPVFVGGPKDQISTAFRCAMGLSPLEESALWAEARAAVVCDSAAQHLAYRFQVPAVVLWAGTHPLGGFAAPNPMLHWHLPERLPCQPCSIFGADSCRRGDWACRKALTADSVREALGQLGI